MGGECRAIIVTIGAKEQGAAKLQRLKVVNICDVIVPNSRQSIGTVNQTDLASTQIPAPQGCLVMHKILRQLALMFAVMVSLTGVQPSMSQERQRAGAGAVVGHLIANDLHGGGQNRWRSASYVISELGPFAEIQVKVKTVPRLGADALSGGRDTAQLRWHDVTTGQIYNSVGAHVTPNDFMLGAGVTPVWSAQHLSDPDGYLAEPVQVSTSKADMSYGVTWLGSAIKDQPSGQMGEALNVSLRF